jgi:uncharacterized protein YqgC (DUF456 family)
MEWLMWSIIILCWVIGFAGAILPIIPGVFFMVLGFLVYDWFSGFEELTFGFWLTQAFCVLILVLIDYWLSAYMIKKFGGSQRSVWGGTIGLLIGPWITIGMFIGTFIGTVASEYSVSKDWRKALYVGWGAILSFVVGAGVKVIVQLIMVIHFFWMISGETPISGGSLI